MISHYNMVQDLAGEFMKIDKLAPIAEIVSSIAIVITLIYLSIQTQQTNAALLANSRQTTLTADVDLISTLINNPEIVENAGKSEAELSLAENGQVGNAIAGLVRTREFAFHQYKNGILDKATLDSYMGTIVRWIKMGEVTLSYWEVFSREIDPEFVNYVNSLILKTP